MSPVYTPATDQARTLIPYAVHALEVHIFEALGEASACWEHLADAGVFDSTRAREIGERLVETVVSTTSMSWPCLGLATNRQMEDELAVRAGLGHTDPDYRTVDS